MPDQTHQNEHSHEGGRQSDFLMGLFWVLVLLVAPFLGLCVLFFEFLTAFGVSRPWPLHTTFAVIIGWIIILRISEGRHAATVLTIGSTMTLVAFAVAWFMFGAV